MSIILDKVNYVYSEGTAYQIQALKDVNLTIEDGQFIGVIGHTGSGKSTLIQHLNGLMKATSGTIYFHGQDIYEDDFDLRELRNRVGLVFQYPESDWTARMSACALTSRRVPCRPSAIPDGWRSPASSASSITSQRMWRS